MSTSVQISANQSNALLSTGPKTEAGKRASSRNNYRHGLHASPESLRGKDRHIYLRILDHLTNLNPDDRPAIKEWVEKAAILEFRLDRCAALENAYLAGRVRFLRQTNPLAKTKDDARMLALEEDAKGPKVLDKLWRQESRLRNELRHAYHMLSCHQNYEAEGIETETTRENSKPIAEAAKWPVHLGLGLENASPQTAKMPVNLPVSAQIPRGARCPCGSGEKYKRCCGVNAPPVLHGRAA